MANPDQDPIPDDLDPEQDPWAGDGGGEEEGAGKSEEESNPWKSSEATITDFDPEGDWTQSHHGVLVLVFGILGLAGICLCQLFIIFSIIALIIGYLDLQKIREGTMDPSGEGLCRAGFILGIIGLSIHLVFFLAMLGFYAYTFFNQGGF